VLLYVAGAINFSVGASRAAHFTDRTGETLIDPQPIPKSLTSHAPLSYLAGFCNRIGHFRTHAAQQTQRVTPFP
jgi:hypothetical protein